jgi:ligand-binding sensor domain-containing protein
MQTKTAIGARSRSVTLFSIAIAVCAVTWSGRAYCDSRWQNYVDPSVVNTIVYRDGELFMATSGGIVIYTLGSGQFEQLTNSTDLPSNALTSLLFDAGGSLWIGTQDVGVIRVTLGPDGPDVRTFSPLEFPSQHITALDIWDGEIVYGTVEGAGKFEGGVPGPWFTENKGLPSNQVNDVLAYGDVVWFATAAGAAILDRLGFITPVTGGPTVAKSLAKSDDAVWIGSDDGVWRKSLADTSWSQIGPAGYPIYSLFWDGQKMWAGGTYYVYERNEAGDYWFEYDLRYDLRRWGLNNTLGEIRGLCRTPSGDVYAGGTATGAVKGFNLVRVDSTDNENLVPNAPAENRVQRLAYDIDGSVWISTFGFWVGKLTTSGQWVNYNRSIPESDSLTNQFQNLALLADLEGHKWFSTLTQSLSNLKPMDELDDKLDADYSNDVWSRHRLGSGGGDTYGTLRPQRARLDPAGNRWFLADDAPDIEEIPESWRGIHILSRDKTEWLQITPVTRPQMKGGDISHVQFRDDGTVFIAMRDYGVMSWYIGGSGYDWATLKDPTFDIWGGEIDASLLDDDQLGAAGKVTSLALRSDNVLWIGTDAGVFKHIPISTYIRISEKLGSEVGLLSPKVEYIQLDHLENLWVATDLGLNRIAFENDNDIRAYTTAPVFQRLLEAGIPYPTSVISPLAGERCTELMMHPGRDVLYIATHGGVSVLDVSPPPVLATDLEKVYVYPNPVDGGKGQGELKIGNVDAPVAIDVYNVEGNLVHSQTATQSGDVVWDLTTKSGFIVSSGTYLVRIDNGVSAVVLPIVVVR